MKSKKKIQLEKGTVLNNMSWLVMGSVVRMAVQLVLGLISARYLGPSNYGVLNYVTAFINLFSIICELGLSITIVNQLVTQNDQNGETLGTAIVLRAVTSIASIIVLQIIIAITDPGNHTIQIVMLIRSFGLVFESLNSIHCWYEAKLQSKYSAIIELVAYLISATYKIAILIMRKDVRFFAAASVIDLACIGIFYLIVFYKHYPDGLSFSSTKVKVIMKPALPFIISGIMIYIYDQTDRIMIGKMIDQTAVGYYSCAATIASLIGFFTKAMINSGKAVIMETNKTNHMLYLKRLRQTLAAVMWISIIYGVGVLLLGKVAIYILYGEDYLPALISMQVLAFSVGFSYSGTLRNIYLICESKNKYSSVFSFIGAIMNVILNVLLIPLWGINGAAIATLVTLIATSFLLPLLFRDTREYGMIMIQSVLLKNVDIQELLENMRLKR